MKRTTGIFIVAGLLALVAIVLARGTEPRVEPSPPSPAPTPPSVVTRTVTNGAVSLSATLSSSHLLRGDTAEAFLDISMTAKQPARRRRVPLNVGLVIDRSGSMAGPKLTHAKAAAFRLVDNLRDGDRLSIVTYGSDVTLFQSRVISSSSRVQLKALVRGIVDGGGTYLSGGFERARDEVLRVADESYINRVILISDGQANEGVTDTDRLSRMSRKSLGQGVHLTTMGVGLGFNETLMTAMAEHGGGHYYFIEDSSSMASIFDKELKTLMHTVARKATLTLTLEPGVKLVEVYGYTYETNGRQVTIHLPDIFGGQQSKVMCKLRLPASRLGKLQVAEVQLAFVDVDSGKAMASRSTPEVTITSDEVAVKRSKNKLVMTRVEQVVISKNLNEAMQAYSSGDVSAARAKLRHQISSTMRANRKLKNAYLNRLLGKMQRQLKATEAAPSSPKGKSLVKSTRFDAYQLAK